MKNKLKECVEQVRSRKNAPKPFSINGWTDEELETLITNEERTVEELKELLPKKTEARILLAQKDLINRRLYEISEKYSDEEVTILRDNCGKSLRQLMRLLPNRSPWSILSKRRSLGLTRWKNNTFRYLNDDEMDSIFCDKISGVRIKNICENYDISRAQFHSLFYSTMPSKRIESFRIKYDGMYNRENKNAFYWWSKEEELLLEKLVKEGYLLDDLADAFNIGKHLIRCKITNMGLSSEIVKTKTKEMVLRRKEKLEEQRVKFKEDLDKLKAEKEALIKEIKEVGLPLRGIKDYWKEIREVLEIIKEGATEQDKATLKSLSELAEKIDCKSYKSLICFCRNTFNKEKMEESKHKEEATKETLNIALNTVLTFGKYRGETIASVLKKDKDYLEWFDKASKEDNSREAVSIVMKYFGKHKGKKLKQEVNKFVAKEDPIKDLSIIPQDVWG